MECASYTKAIGRQTGKKKDAAEWYGGGDEAGAQETLVEGAAPSQVESTLVSSSCEGRR